MTFKNNSAKRYGGAVYSINSNVSVDGNSSVTFNNNEAGNDGGAAIHLVSHSMVAQA